MHSVRHSIEQEQYIRYCKDNSGRVPFRLIGLLITGVTMSDVSSIVMAQSLTPDPGAWRQMSYADLQRPSQETATYSDIWKDAIDANNRRYRERGDERFADGNAPVTEAHFVIWSAQRSAVLSILDTATNCTIKSVDHSSRITIKLCPMRIAIYEGIQVHTMEAGRGCFVEPDATASFDPASSGAYASYDVANKTVKIGLIVNHSAVDGCSFNVPLSPR